MRSIAIVSIALLCATYSFAQNKNPIQKELFGSFNLVDSYDGEPTDIMSILNNDDQNVYSNQVAKLKECYEIYSSTPMDDQLFDELLDVSKENYEVWDNIRKTIPADPNTAMVIRSILMSMKSKF